jgi:hypothetical protein
MLSKFSLFCTLWLGLLATFGPHDAVAAERPDRLTREAVALFRSVVKQHKPREFGSCTLTDRWNDYPVPEEVARRHLGMKLHAELVSPSRTTPAEVIDPEGAIRQAFCSNSEAAKQTEALVEGFRSGAINIEKGPYDLYPRLTPASGLFLPDLRPRLQAGSLQAFWHATDALPSTAQSDHRTELVCELRPYAGGNEPFTVSTVSTSQTNTNCSFRSPRLIEILVFATILPARVWTICLRRNGITPKPSIGSFRLKMATN